MAPTTPHEPTGPDLAGASDVAQQETVRLDVPSPPREAVRVPLPRGAPRARRAPVLVAAIVTAGWAALLSATPVVFAVGLAQLVDAPHGSVGGAIRYGLAGWLLAHGVPLHTGLGTVGLVPLAVSALAAWRVSRAGVHTTRAIGGRRTGSPRVALVASVAVAVAYGLLGALAAVVARGPGLGVSPLRAAVTLGAFGLVAALTGALRAAGAVGSVAARLPPVVRDATRTGSVAALLVLAAGGALAGLAVALAGGSASDTFAAYDTGVAGQAGITLLCLAYVPNLGIWAATYLLGPGFAVGTETIVRANETSVGALPALPVFAGLPSAPLPSWGGLLVAAPLAAGLFAGWLLARRRIRAARRAGASWAGLLGGAALAGPVGGVVLGVAAWVSGGPLATGRLSAVGPVPWEVAMVGAAVLATGTLLGALATRALVGSPK